MIAGLTEVSTSTPQWRPRGSVHALIDEIHRCCVGAGLKKTSSAGINSPTLGEWCIPASTPPVRILGPGLNTRTVRISVDAVEYYVFAQDLDPSASAETLEHGEARYQGSGSVAKRKCPTCVRASEKRKWRHGIRRFRFRTDFGGIRGFETETGPGRR